MDDLGKKLGINFKNKQLLAESLTHRSYLNEHPESKTSNERLEFLGDSVLSLLTSTRLFHDFPDFPEGQLTNLRSNLVRARTLADISKDLGLGEYLLLSRGEEKSGGRANESLLANLFEAVLGAIYLDQGLDKANDFLENHLFSKIPTISAKTAIFDYKSLLQEVTQNKAQVSPIYKVLSEIGPDHNKTFVIGVYLRGEKLAEGQGHSKQEGEQKAASLAIKKLE